MTSLGPVTYQGARYGNSASRLSLTPVDESLGLVEDYQSSHRGPARARQRWSLDFVTDALPDSRCFRLLVVISAFIDGQSAVNLAEARLRHIAGSIWSTKQYVNMDLLKQQRNTA